MDFGVIKPIVVGDLTQAKVSGEGVFDVLMRSVAGHLELEYDRNRIKGPEYSQVYLGGLTAVLGQSVGFLLQKDDAAMKAALTEQQVLLAKEQVKLAVLQQEMLQLEIEREVLNKALIAAQTAQIIRQTTKIDSDELLVKAQTTNVTKEGLVLDKQVLKITEDVKLVTAQVLNAAKEGLILDKQALKVTAETAKIGSDDLMVKAETLNTAKEGVILEKQALKVAAETINVITENDTQKAQQCLLKGQYDQVMAMVIQTTAQTSLIQQKVATEKAQTVGAGVDTNSVIGKQIALYHAQSQGFKRDAEQKAAKIFADTWNVRRTTDDGTVADATNMLYDPAIGRAMAALLAGVENPG